MKKSLHYSILCALVLLFHLPTMAQEVLINFVTETTQPTANNTFTHTVSGFTFTATKEKGLNPPKHFTSTTGDLRLYAKNKLVISSETPFNRLVFNISNKGLEQWADLIPSKGDKLVANKDAKTATWEAPEPVTSMEFIVGDDNAYGNKRGKSGRLGQFFFNSVSITKVNGNVEVVEAPTFSHQTGNYFDAFDLVLTAPEGYSIYYTDDLSIPNNNSKRYNTPIKITSLMTIKAVAYNAAGKKSFVVEHTFTFPAIRANIAEMKQLAAKETAKLTFQNAMVLAASNERIFIADNSGAIMLYKTGLNYTPGTILNGTLICKFDTFEGLPEIISAGNDTKADLIQTTPGNLPTPKETSLSEIKNNDMLCKLVKISGVTLDSVGNKLYANVGNERIEVFNNTLQAIPAGTKLAKGSTNNTITAIVGIYKNNYQLLPTTTEGLHLVATGIKSAVAKEETTGKDVLYNLAGQRVNADYKGVVIKNGKKYILK